MKDMVAVALPPDANYRLMVGKGRGASVGRPTGFRGNRSFE